VCAVPKSSSARSGKPAEEIAESFAAFGIGEAGDDFGLHLVMLRSEINPSGLPQIVLHATKRSLKESGLACYGWAALFYGDFQLSD
jgi:hypothetical protein